MAERHVVWSDAARDDVRAIAFHIAQDNLDNALSVADRLQRRADTLTSLSTRGRSVPELRRLNERFRELMEDPWRILYRVEESTVYVVAVVDSRRDVQAWRNARVARFGVART